ncbi:cytochrome P450 4C1-like [Diachasmimorpha longicaudata]|uniref:cytochrome P450 4C1-like n=1 Tax=Diachasmimorpha longicaudata TaxID=58733 RepID=UPI0030B89403
MTWVSSFEGSSISPAIGALIATVVIVVGLRWWSREFWKEKSRISKFAMTLPGPARLPILGNILELWETDKTVNTLTRIGQEINSRLYQFWLGPTVVKIIVTDPKDLEIAYMSTKAADKDDVYKFMEPAVINGLINAPGSLHYRTHKNLMMPQINGNSVMRKHVEEFNNQSQILVQQLKKKVDAQQFDIHDYINFCLGDAVFVTLFGVPGTAQLGEPSIFLLLTQTCLHSVYYRMMRPWLAPNILFRLTQRGRDYFRVVKEGHQYLDDIIADKKRNYERRSPEETAELPLLDFLIDHVMINNDWTDEELRYEMVTIFVASYETMTGVACFALLMIAMHPEVQRKAREEVENVMRCDNISESEIANLKYLEMIVRETVRLFPVAPLMPRKVNADLKLSTCTVPKGTSLFLLPYATHMDPELWDEPKKFIPERFTPENSKNRHPFAYIPFSGGMRSCPGSKYGAVGVKVLLAHVLRNYHLSTTMKLETLRVHNHISARSVDGYQISLKSVN